MSAAFQKLDPFERFDPRRDVANNSFIRTCIKVECLDDTKTQATGFSDAWIYIFNKAKPEDFLNGTQSRREIGRRIRQVGRAAATSAAAPEGASGYEYADRLIAEGVRAREACQMARVSPSAYYNWRKHYIRYVFFYGSLRRGQKGYIELELDKYLRYYAEDRVPGKLYDLGEYPGMKPAKAAVPTAIKGELYWINDERVLPVLDEFERYVHRGKSLYLRKTVTTMKHMLRAWAYLYNGQASQKRLIESGDWIGYKSGEMLV